MKKNTIKDIADMTDLSIGTISKYINGGSVKTKNKAKLDDAIQKLDFHVNNFARGLKTQESKTIGILIPSLDNYFCTTLVEYIEQALAEFGYSVIVCGYQNQVAKQKEKLALLLDQMVDGLVVVPSFEEQITIDFDEYPDIPIIFVDRVFEGSQYDTIALDNVQIAHDLVDELINKGHERIGIILGPTQLSTSKERQAGFIKAMHEHHINIADNYVLNGSYTLQHGYESTLKLLDTNTAPTAIFATNFDITLGLVKAVHEKKIKIPDELSIVGFDNLQIATVFDPPLTIIEQPMQKIGQTVVQRLLFRINNDTNEPSQIIRVPAKIVEGASVKEN